MDGRSLTACTGLVCPVGADQPVDGRSAMFSIATACTGRVRPPVTILPGKRGTGQAEVYGSAGDRALRSRYQYQLNSSCQEAGWRVDVYWMEVSQRAEFVRPEVTPRLKVLRQLAQRVEAVSGCHACRFYVTKLFFYAGHIL